MEEKTFNILKEGNKIIVRGRPGEKGDSPTKEELLSIIEPLIPEPIKGEDGKDYILTEKDKKEIAKSIPVPVVEKVIEKREIIKEQPIITNEIQEVAIHETPLQIKEKLETLKKDKRLDASAIKGLSKLHDDTLNRAIGILDQRTQFLINKIPSREGLIAETFETVSKNLKSYPYTFNKTGDVLDSITYTLPSGTIVKTFNRTGTVLNTVVLSGDTPSGIDLTKTFNRTGEVLTSITYS